MSMQRTKQETITSNRIESVNGENNNKSTTVSRDWFVMEASLEWVYVVIHFLSTLEWVRLCYAEMKGKY